LLLLTVYRLIVNFCVLFFGRVVFCFVVLWGCWSRKGKKNDYSD